MLAWCCCASRRDEQFTRVETGSPRLFGDRNARHRPASGRQGLVTVGESDSPRLFGDRRYRYRIANPVNAEPRHVDYVNVPEDARQQLPKRGALAPAP